MKKVLGVEGIKGGQINGALCTRSDSISYLQTKQDKCNKNETDDQTHPFVRNRTRGSSGMRGVPVADKSGSGTGEAARICKCQWDGNFVYYSIFRGQAYDAMDGSAMNQTERAR